jgi:hypothetical protein
MTHPDGTPYSRTERRAIIKQARATARELLGLLELLSITDGGGNENEAVPEGAEATSERDAG